MAARPSASVAGQDGNPTDEYWITYMDADLYGAAEKSTKGYDVTLRKHLSAYGLWGQLTPQENNLLHIASQFGQLGPVNVILNHLRSSRSMFLLKQRNLKGDTALHLAAREGHHEVVKALIQAASDVGRDKAMILMTMKNKEGGIALHEAVRYNHEKVVKLLVEEGPGLTYGADCSGHSTPLELAVERGYGDLVKIINKAPKCKNSPAHTGSIGIDTALHAAVKGRNVDMVKELLKQKPSPVNKVNAKGWSPLHVAASERDNISAEIILKDKSLDRSVIYLGIKDGNRTALHLASWVGCIEIVKLLLKHAPDCSEQVDADGRNVFHFATMNNYRSNFASDLLKVDELRPLQVRGLVNEKDAHGHTPYRLLASSPKIPPASFRGGASGYEKDPPFTEHVMVDKKERQNQKQYAQEKMELPTPVKFN